MPPEERTGGILGHLRLRLLPELAGLAKEVTRLREELAACTRQAETLATQAHQLSSQMEGERASLLTRGPLRGTALAGQDRIRATQRARLQAIVAEREEALARHRSVSRELAARLGLLARCQRRLEVVDQRREQARIRHLRREADARLEDLVEDCARPV